MTFWRDSMINKKVIHGSDRRFHSKQQLKDFQNKNELIEIGPQSKAHLKRVKDFVGWVKDEKKKNPDFEKTKQYKSARYPDSTH